MLTVSRNVRVEWGDCDPAGIVYFPRYFEYFDISTVGMFEALGYRKHVFEDGFPFGERQSAGHQDTAPFVALG